MSERLLQSADPGASFRVQADEIRAAIDRVLASGRYILGPEVEAFESEFSAFLGGGYTIGVANGTDALEIALRAAGVGPGDLVATVANTVSATASAIDATGASSVFVEIDADTMLMSASALESVLARTAGRVKAVVPVHLYGHPVDMPHVTAVSAKYGALVVEDCAQAHGAASGGRTVGTWGELAAFSFYPTKNLGALGDAGAVFTRDAALAERATLLRQYGWRTRYVSETNGRNSRLDELQAAILRVKLEALDAANEYRRHLAARYMSRLSDAPLTLPASSAHAVYHQFAIRISDRDAMQAALLERGIACAVLYPVPLHHQPAWLDEAVSLPVTEQACDNVLCLPCHPGLKLEDVDRVCDAIVALAAGIPHTISASKP
jgi:dTDP-4-amino-4,6-dideoxygalactose transaminase